MREISTVWYTVQCSLLVHVRHWNALDQIQTASNQVSAHSDLRADCPLKAAVWFGPCKNKTSSLCSYIPLNRSTPLSSTTDVSAASHAATVDRGLL